MAKDKVIEETVETSIVEEPKYSKDELLDGALEVFNVRREVLAGALASVKGELTISQAKSLLNSFLNRRAE